jgi:O-antigen/teichoic acid export membrane protein
MSAQTISKKTPVLRFFLMFVVLFVVIFVTGTILQALGLESYMPFVAGAVAGGTSLILNLILNRKLKEPANTGSK